MPSYLPPLLAMQREYKADGELKGRVALKMSSTGFNLEANGELQEGSLELKEESFHRIHGNFAVKGSAPDFTIKTGSGSCVTHWLRKIVRNKCSCRPENQSVAGHRKNREHHSLSPSGVRYNEEIFTFTRSFLHINFKVS